MRDRVIVVGGGLAGLTAGVALAEAGRSVHLFEQNPHLGGRARSFRDAANGSVLDNGQHILMGCYHSTRRFLATIGTLDRIRFQPRLAVHFLDAGRLTALRCPSLPAPWHLLAGVLASRSFSTKEKLEVARLGRALTSAGQGKAKRKGSREGSNGIESMTAEDWLTSLGQSERLRRNFWDLFCTAAMNEHPRIASAAIFERVLRLALLHSPEDSRIGIPRAGLSECYADAARDFITERGGRVELRRRVHTVMVAEGRVRGVGFVGGETIEAATVLSAVPWFAACEILPADLLALPFFSRIKALRPTPIVSIYLWFDRPVTDLDFIGLRGLTVQWLFNKSKNFGARENYVSLVLSGAHAHIARSREDLAGMAMRELASLLPEARSAALERSLVIKERLATFSPVVGVEALRPPALTPIRGLYLAGDWTATGLPATIEGAVRSGYTAAEAVLADSEPEKSL